MGEDKILECKLKNLNIKVLIFKQMTLLGDIGDCFYILCVYILNIITIFGFIKRFFKEITKIKMAKVII